MDGVHDMGGMHGFGPVETEATEAFHADWERAAYATMKLVIFHGLVNGHEMRHAQERMPPGAYLTTPYFGRWVDALERRLVETDVIDGAALADRQRAVADGSFDPETVAVDEAHTADLLELVREVSTRGASLDAEADTEDARFAAGDRVRILNRHPPGHTRSPRYTRGIEGTVRSVLGSFEVPDAAAHGADAVEPSYSVRLESEALWGADGTENDAVYVDVYERYLEPLE